MKTAEDHVSDFFSEPSMMSGMLADGFKSYARQCCEDVLRRAAENAENAFYSQEHDARSGTAYKIDKSILHTEILTP